MTPEAGVRSDSGRPGGDVLEPDYQGADPDLPPRHNGEVEWARFNTGAYWDHNYRSLRKDDQAILHVVGEFFAERFGARRGRLSRVGTRDLHGIDVGSGPNLYPALTMLPWCDRITLSDISAPNITWLQEHFELPAADPWSWQEFWDELLQHDGYDQVVDPAQRLRAVQKVERRSVLELPQHTYDMGTMFFVAESMTSYPREFEDATATFLRSLRPGAPFAAAFMDSSSGYEVAGESFPAVREVDVERVAATLRELDADAAVQKIDIVPTNVLRNGYEGMIIAMGTTRREA
jgi:hypothetical protein